jgi:hypothetical protein
MVCIMAALRQSDPQDQFSAIGSIHPEDTVEVVRHQAQASYIQRILLERVPCQLT